MFKNYTLEDIKRIAMPIAEQFGVEKLALFGSYARGEQHERSDLDFLIEKGKVQDWYQFYDFVTRLEQDFEMPVDVLTYDSLKESYIYDAIEDEVILYEK